MAMRTKKYVEKPIMQHQGPRKYTLVQTLSHCVFGFAGKGRSTVPMSFVHHLIAKLRAESSEFNLIFKEHTICQIISEKQYATLLLAYLDEMVYAELTRRRQAEIATLETTIKAHKEARRLALLSDRQGSSQ